MTQNKPHTIRIDLNQFKLHLQLKPDVEVTLHFNSPSRRFYLSVIGLVLHAMQKQQRMISISLQEHLAVLQLLNETVGGGAGSSKKSHLLPRIYVKWKDALPDLENAPLFKVVGRKKSVNEAMERVYVFSETEQDNWANLFEYKGSHENVRLRFSLDRLGINLEDAIIVYGDTQESAELNAWEGFIAQLEKERESKSGTGEALHVLKTAEARTRRPEGEGGAASNRRRVVVLCALAVIALGLGALGAWKYHLFTSRDPVPAIEGQSSLSHEKPSIAVLPFKNFSDDPQQEYFSDGLTDELIGDLAKISDILVISRNSAFTYKNKQVKIPQIAKELNVRYLLEGSVQKSGERVRIRAQLIDGETDLHLWAESYDGVMNDILDVQDKIIHKIVTALAIKLSPFETEKVADKGTDNIFAYEAFLKGEGHFVKHTPQDFLKAIEYYKQAADYDPNFSRAYAEIGRTYQAGGNYLWSTKMGISLSTMRLLSRKYLELAMNKPTPEAYSLAAAKEIHRREFSKSIAFAEKACQYSPNSADMISALAWKLAFTGKSTQSIELLNKAIRLDPLDTKKNTPFSYIFIGINFFHMGHLEAAVNYLEKGLTINSGLNNFSCFLAASHALLGNEIEAQEALEDFFENYPKGFPASFRLQYQAWPFRDSRVFERLAKGLVMAGFPGDPTNYYKMDNNEKLSGQEVKNLLFGKTSSGYLWGLKPLEWRLSISEAGEIDFRFRGKTYGGKAWIEDEDICLLREEYHGGLKSCESIYRNREGDDLTKTEYFRVTDYGLYLFSVDNLAHTTDAPNSNDETVYE